jgi:ArsR family transcriptional regulator, lead/cadmium/zinc/bismuth-responsive transcriptional repressor
MTAMADDRCDILCLDLEKAEDLRSRRLSPAHAERGAGDAKALGDPTRLTLAAALGEGGELCVCDLAWVVERAENLVSHHLRLLRSAGLVTSRRDGKMVMYSLSERGAELLAATLAEGAAR